MKKIFLVYGHYSEKSFNAAIRDEFIKSLKEKGHHVDCLDLYKEKFNPVFAGEKPDNIVLDHRERIEKSDVIAMVAPIWNFRMPAILEGWIDKVLAPPWAFSFKNYLEIMVSCWKFKRKKGNCFLYIRISTICNSNFLFKYAYKKIKKRCV